MMNGQRHEQISLHERNEIQTLTRHQTMGSAQHVLMVIVVVKFTCATTITFIGQIAFV